MTIFVNKPQFNRKNDYKKYPRNIKNDIKKLKKLKIIKAFTKKNYPNIKIIGASFTD